MGDNLDQPTGQPSNGAGNGSGGQFTLLDDGTLVMNGGAKYVPIDRFNGLNGTVQKLVEEKRGLQAQITELNGQHTTSLAELTAQVKELEGLKGTLEQQIQAVTGEKDTLAGERQKLTGELTTTKLFLSDKYAPLASSYAKGTINLNGLEGEEAVASFLDKILEERQQLVQQSQEVQSAGSSPSTPQGGSAAPNLNTQQLAEKLTGLSYGSPEYAETYRQWEASLSQP